MTDKDNDSTNKIFIAIDIAKQSHDALIAWHDGKTKACKIPNTLAGYQR